MKENMNEIGLQILNCVWDGLNEATWYTEEKKFTLDYVCIDGRGLNKVVSASILDLGEMIESDYAAIRVEIEWKGVMGQCQKKKRCLNKQKWEVFGRWMNGKEFENMSEINSMMSKEGCEMEKGKNWQEDRRMMIRKGDKQLCTWSQLCSGGKDGVMEWKSQAGFLYLDDMCLMANSEEDMKVIMEKVYMCS